MFLHSELFLLLFISLRSSYAKLNLTHHSYASESYQISSSSNSQRYNNDSFNLSNYNDSSSQHQDNISRLFNAKFHMKNNNNSLANQLSSNETDSSLTKEESSNSSVLDALISVPLIILFSKANYSNSNSNPFQLNDNETLAPSESRTLSSWLGLNLNRFRRPQRKDRPRRPGFHPGHHGHYHQQFPPYVPPPPPFIANLFPRPDGFPAPDDPEAVLLSPDLFEESGIKYWLKFIENGGNLDQLEGSSLPEPQPKPVYVEHKRKRIPSRQTSYEPNQSKPIQIGEKPTAMRHTLYHEDTGDDHDQTEETSKDSSQDSSVDNHKYDTTPRCDKFTTDICIDDFEYPEQAIVDEIYKKREIFELMYSEVQDNVPLVDGIPRDVEESYNYEHYYNREKDDYDSHSSGDRYADKSNSGNSGNSGGFVCPSEVLYAKPKLAKNRKGDWKVIVNAAEFTQTVRMEKCIKPNSRCNYISSPNFNSRCAQVHSIHRLMVFEKGKGFHIDTFRIPTACTCHVNKRITYKPLQSNSDDIIYDNNNNNNLNKKQNQQALSNTLWSILGGNSMSGANMNGNGNSNIESTQAQLKEHLNLLNQLKQFPQFAAQISPENVLQQLMDLQSPSTSNKKQNSNSQDNLSQNTMEYLLPSLLTDNTNTQQQVITKVQPATTTFVHPNGNHGGAPVVQVIHVPVTSNIPSNQPAPVYRPQGQSNHYGDDSLTILARKASSKNADSKSPPDNYRPMLLHMQSKSNTTLISPHPSLSPKDLQTASSIINKKTNLSNYDDNKETRKDTQADSSVKKINFSYHPILDFISN